VANPNLLTCSIRRQDVEIRVIAMLDLAARRAEAARPPRRIGVETQQAAGQVKGKRRLADARGTADEKGVRRAFRDDAALDEGDCSAMAAGGKHTHAEVPAFR
jgi:hypothetical protein